MREHARLCSFAHDTSVAGLAGFSKISDAYEKSDALAESLAVWTLSTVRKRRKGYPKQSSTCFCGEACLQVLAGTSVALKVNDLVSLPIRASAAHLRDWF
jgi:hypothetical protein